MNNQAEMLGDQTPRLLFRWPQHNNLELEQSRSAANPNCPR